MARRNSLGAWARLVGRNMALIQRGVKQAGRIAKAQAVTAAKLAKAAKAAKAAQAAQAKQAAQAEKAAKARQAGTLAKPAKPANPARRARPATPAHVTPARRASTTPARTAPRASASTGRNHPGVALGPAGARRYTVFCPTGLQPGERVPLLVMLHGCQQDAAAMALCTRMNALASRERFIVLYPDQDRMANAQGCWNWFAARHGRAQGEAALILQAIGQVALQYPVDASRIAVAGLSAGASMAALVVAQQPQRFQAVVMHSGVAAGTAQSTLQALSAMRGGRAIPPLAATADAMAAGWPALLVIHGSADTVVAPANGAAAAQAWADAAGARASAPRRLQRGQRHAMTVTDYRARGRTVATLALVDGLGHAWSGGAAGQPFADARGPDAARLLWAFAQRQFKRVRR